MIVQQNCVFTLIEHSDFYRNGMLHFGVYPNFKSAYERLEEIAKGKAIVDFGDHYSSVMFEVIDTTRDLRHKEYYGHCSIRRFSITRSLMNVRDGDTLIIPEMIDEIMKANKGCDDRAAYKANNEVL